MWRSRETLVLLGVALWLCPLGVRGYFMSVDAHAEECFFDRVSSGMKMSLTFEVVEGGFLDIDVKVKHSNYSIPSMKVTFPHRVYP